MSVLSSISKLEDLAGEADHAAKLSPRTLWLRPRRGWQTLDLHTLWQRRELLLQLVQRDLKVRYKQTLLGTGWAILQPLLAMVVLGWVFGPLAAKTTGQSVVPYSIFLMVGLVPWTFFAGAVNAGSQSLVAHSSLLSKVYFPRLIMPMSALGAPLVDWTLASVVLFLLLALYQVELQLSMLLLPLCVLSLLLAALSVSIWLSTVAVSYRDVRHVVPFLIQVWFFVTPVILPASALPTLSSCDWLIYLNPVAGAIEVWRSALLGTSIPWLGWSVSSLSTLVILITGLHYFARTQRRFADVI